MEEVEEEEVANYFQELDRVFGLLHSQQSYAEDADLCEIDDKIVKRDIKRL